VNAEDLPPQPRRFPGYVRSYRTLYSPVGGDLSPKRPVRTPKIFLRSPDAFPDTSGPTDSYTTR
jgi:hypothetical protein